MQEQVVVPLQSLGYKVIMGSDCKAVGSDTSVECATVDQILMASSKVCVPPFHIIRNALHHIHIFISVVHANNSLSYHLSVSLGGIFSEICCCYSFGNKRCLCICTIKLLARVKELVLVLATASGY